MDVLVELCMLISCDFMDIVVFILGPRPSSPCRQASALDAATTAVKLVWRHGERKRSYTMDDRPQVVLRELDAVNEDIDLCYFEDDQSVGVFPERPLAHGFDFMEIPHQGQDRVSKHLSAWGFVSAPVFSR